MGIELDLWAFAAVAAVFAVGGLVKGLVAFGLPLVMVPPLSLIFPVPTAVALVVVPILASNVWQMVHGEWRERGVFGDTVRRLWPLIAAMVIALALSTHLLVELDETVITLIAGTVVLAIAVSDFMGLRLGISPRHERWAGPAVGACGGLIGGVTSFFGTLPLMYLVALKFPKDRFVTAASVILFCGGVTLLAMLSKLTVLGRDEIVLSSLGLVPLFGGILIGQKLRARIDQALFRRLVLAALVIVGLSMILRVVIR